MRATRRGGAALAVALLCASGAACSSDDDGGAGTASGAGDTGATTTTAPPADLVYPGAEWARADPAEMGFDPAALEALAADAQDAGSNCLVVTRKGRLVAEWYWNETDATTSQEVFSATKSVGSTLVGIAQADGDLSVEDRASQYIPEWAGTDSEDVTIEHLLSNDSGRHWSLQSDYQRLVQAPDRDAYAVGLGQDAPPGTTWAYNNAAIQTLDVVLRTATGRDTAELAEERLLGPIGMSHSDMTRDNVGNPLIFIGLHATCQDMARFGYLFLRHGAWDGQQIVPAEWVEAATGRSSQELNAGFGYLWWLNRRGHLADPMRAITAEDSADVPDGQMAPGAPEEMYWALGLGGQIVSVDPGSETVVVRLGPSGGQGYGPADAAKVVTEALVDP